MNARLGFGLLFATGCFRPSYEHAACSPRGECPDGLTCSAQGVCSAAETPDAREPAPVDATAVGACTTFSSLVDTCALSLTRDLVLSGTALYDTTNHLLTVNGVALAITTSILTLAGEDPIDAILAHDVRLAPGTVLRATGVHPVAILAGGVLQLDDGARIDVSAGGAGARSACDDAATAGMDHSGGGGGGGGGGFGAAGSDGGAGDSDGRQAPSLGGHGAVGTTRPLSVRGGCAGAPGGAGTGAPGAGGLGGGAVYLAAGDHLELGSAAAISAGGAGGGGGGRSNLHVDGGGGGGGAGGMIMIEAPRILGGFAVVAANGGGGGEGGSDEAAGVAGASGELSTQRAAGGAGGSLNGADGGAGGSSDTPGGGPPATSAPGGGGGGGGSVGFIQLVSAAVQLGTVSPRP